MRRFLGTALFAPLLLAGKCGKKPTDEEPVSVDPGRPVSPEVDVQVAAIEPDTVEPSRAFDAAIYGQGFEYGARAWVGKTELVGAEVKDENTIVAHVPAMGAGAFDVMARNPDGGQAILRKGLLVREPTGQGEPCPTVTVRFAFDAATLDAASRASLEAAARCFQARGGAVRVEGHCDERGTTDYNLALGQRRAEAIERLLVGQGVPPSHIRTISYGEERPLDRSDGEAAWAANRRGEIEAIE